MRMPPPLQETDMRALDAQRFNPVSLVTRTNPLAGRERFALRQPRELATALGLARDSDLSGRIEDRAGTDRPGKTSTLSIRLQSAFAVSRPACGLRVLLLQPAGIHSDQLDVATGHRAGLPGLRIGDSRGLGPEHGPGR